MGRRSAPTAGRSSRAEVAAAAAADAGGIDATLLGDYLAVVESATTTGRRLTRHELDRFKAAGARAAETSVQLRDLVDLYLSATWRLWRQLPVVDQASGRERWLEIGEAVLRAADDSAAAVAEGFAEALRVIVRREVSARRELFDDILGGRGDPVRVVESAATFGLHLAGPHGVAVLHGREHFTDGASEVAAVERALADSRPGAVRALVATRDGDLVVVYAVPDDAATDRVVAALQAATRSRTRTARAVSTPPGADRVGVGRGRSGAAGVRASYEDAVNALAVADRLRLREPVVHAKDLLVFDVLMRDRSAVADLVTTLLDPLSRARGGAQPLFDTLEAFLACGGNASEAARRLHLSVRAVTYRLERIAQLTGHDPVDPAERFALQAAIYGARLLDSPDSPGGTRAGRRPRD